MTPRLTLLRSISTLVGSALRIHDQRDGWPAVADVTTEMGIVPLALFVSKVGLTHRDRDAQERRVQNPGQNRPIVVPPSTIPLVLGLWDEDTLVPVATPVLVAADAWKREGNTTRYSIFVSLDGLEQAALTGWDRRANSDGETISCFQPARFQHHVENLLLDAVQHPHIGRLPASFIPAAQANEQAPERAKRAAMQLVRETRFGAQVVTAYAERCALCDLDLGLVEGAHIYPVAAGDSPDEIWNGVSLCANHHVAFDRHYIFVEPATRSIKLHPWLRARADGHASCQTFIQTTRSTLSEPIDRALRPIPEMFSKRYAFFDGSYAWAEQAPTHAPPAVP